MIQIILALLFTAVLSLSGSAATKPNILFIYADDLGYGDTSAYGATAVKTPNVDRLAKEGLRFTSAYATSATCTPSRYSLLTGTYAWRQKGTGILPGDAALIINTSQMTMPKLLQKAGYTTGAIGKWHLGLGSPGAEPAWNSEIKPGPREVGFNYSFIMAATGDRVPCVFVENQRVVGLDTNDPIQVSYDKPFPGEPTGKSERDHLKLDWSHGHNDAVINGIGRIGFMKGGKSAVWKDEDMATTFTRKGVEFIEKNKSKPFFLYFATHDIHVPRVPHQRFVGKTTMGPRGDVIVQFDWCVGQLLATLDRLHLASNTIVVLSSDNGPVVDDGYKDGAVTKLGSHKPAGPYRGGKYSIFEGGTRIPLIVRWPGHVKSGVSDAIVSQIDFGASFASLAGQTVPAGALPDSQNVLPALLGQSQEGRDSVVEHAKVLALRQKNWKYIESGSGPKKQPATNTELGVDSAPQLYDLSKDPGEKENLAEKDPQVTQQLAAALNNIKKGSDKR